MTVQLSRDTYHALRDAVEDAGQLGNLYAGYSGRSMYGDLCLALVCDQTTELMRFVLLLTRVHDEHDGVSSDVAQRLVHDLSAFIVELEAGHTPTRQDSLGHGLVFYWPGVSVAGT